MPSFLRYLVGFFALRPSVHNGESLTAGAGTRTEADDLTDTRTEMSSPEKGRGVPLIAAKALDFVSSQKCKVARWPCGPLWRTQPVRTQRRPDVGRGDGLQPGRRPEPLPPRSTPNTGATGCPRPRTRLRPAEKGLDRSVDGSRAPQVKGSRQAAATNGRGLRGQAGRKLPGAFLRERENCRKLHKRRWHRLCLRLR